MNNHQKPTTTARNVKVLGSHQEEKIGRIAGCLRGNPVKVEDYHNLAEFEHLYFVKTFRHPLAGPCFEVVGKM